MPEKIDLSYAIKLPPEKAIEYFKSKGYKLTWNWYDLWQEAHAKAFTVAKVMRMDVLQDIRDMVQKALDEGITVEQFKKELEPRLKAKGWWGYKFVGYPDGRVERILEGSPWRLKTIYRTNMQTAYMAGRYKAQMEDVDNRPYWQYVAVIDSRTRPAHAALNGKVFRYDDPFWDTHYPPLGFNCRCRVRALSQRDLGKKGLTVESSQGRITWEDALVSKKTGELQTVAVYRDTFTGMKIPTDVGWSYNPGKAAWLPDLDKYDKKIKKIVKKEEALRKLISEKEEEIKNLKYEKCYVFNNEGIVFSKSGQESQIIFDDNSEGVIIRNASVFTHNHPGRRAFSLEDIKFTCDYKIKEMRAVSSKYTYIMKIPDDKLNMEFFEMKIMPLYEKLNAEVRKEFETKIKNKEITVEYAELNHHHEIWTRLARILNLYYVRF
ncbi:hypothetical protein JZK55_17120 [Dissulfurispira thermophila]|uniref:Phage head morphogenesis domain-containing protein n=2 Tax=root TaxID=1 RepID=A0A7G1H1X7_9BACT|nr:phage minor head protein [Dissulfurispira thermophila]BCB96790.1 hypothetical protein JZK55_17120 [Dissulfurispira thermophila]